MSRTGRLAFYDRLAAEVPAGLLGLLRVPGVGPKTVRILYESLGIDSLDELRRAAQAGRLRTVKGLSEKTEASILAGIASLETRSGRMLLGTAEAIMGRLVTGLSDVPGVSRLEPAGSYRRRRETIGDLDLLAETTDAGALVSRFTALPGVERVLGAGEHKAAILLSGGPQVDLMIMPPGEAGTYLIHFTGSKDHNIRLRGLPASAAGACPRRAISAWPRTRSQPSTARPSCARSRPRRRPTPSSTCRSSSPSCARTGARSRRPRRARCPG